MHYEVSYEKEDLKQGFDLMMKAMTNKSVILGLTFLILILLAALYFIGGFQGRNMLMTMAPLFLLVIVFIFFMIALRGGQVRQLMEHSQFFKETSQWTFDEEKVRVTWPSGDIRLHWPYFTGYTLSEKMLLLWASPQQAHMLPLRVVPPDQSEALLRLVKEKTTPFQPVTPGSGDNKAAKRTLWGLFIIVLLLIAILVVLKRQNTPTHPYLPRPMVAPMPWAEDHDTHARAARWEAIPDEDLDYALFALVHQHIYPDGDDGYGLNRLDELAEGYRLTYWTQIAEATIANDGIDNLVYSYGPGTLRGLALSYETLGLPELARIMKESVEHEDRRPALTEAFLGLAPRAQQARITYIRENPQFFPTLE
jgi:hypothetical protein